MALPSAGGISTILLALLATTAVLTPVFLVFFDSLIPLYLSWILMVSCIIWAPIAASYNEFLSLGPGGNQGKMGFLNITWQQLFRQDVLHFPEIPLLLHPQAGVLEGQLPTRWGTRPPVLGIAPQRQFEGRPADPKRMYRQINAELQKLIDERPDYLVRDRLTAHIGSEGVSICGLDNEENRETFRFSQAEFHYDFGHPHRIDGSLHFNLHPADVAAVIKSGFGERHPISRTQWWWRSFWIHIVRKNREALLRDFGIPGRVPTAPGLVFVYAPRDDEELEVVVKIAKAAIWWVTDVPQEI